MSLSRIIREHQVVVCVGSGGVGKTTSSAAIALAAARDGKRVLCLTIDPAKRLANSLGLARFEEHEQRVDPAVLQAQGIDCKGSLHAMMLDMKGTFDELVNRHAKDAAQRDRILNNKLYRYVSTSLAGTQEYMAMEKLHAVRQGANYDLIVLDTPPTTNALDFLDAPERLVAAIDSPMMRWFVETFEQSRDGGLFGKSASFVLKGLARFTGMEFLQLVSEFIVDLNALFGGFRQRATMVYDDLRSDHVAFVLVTSPDPTTVAEALYFGERLQNYAITPKAVLVNRVHRAPDPNVDPAALAPSLTSLGPSPELPSKLERAHQAAHEFAIRDQEGVQQLRDRLDPGIDYTEIPAFDMDVHDLQALALLATHFDD